MILALRLNSWPASVSKKQGPQTTCTLDFFDNRNRQYHCLAFSMDQGRLLSRKQNTLSVVVYGSLKSKQDE